MILNSHCSKKEYKRKQKNRRRIINQKEIIARKNISNDGDQSDLKEETVLIIPSKAIKN